MIAYFCIQGGGARIQGSANFTNCKLHDNQASSGGGIFVLGHVTMADTLLRSNEARDDNVKETGVSDVGGWGGTCTCPDGETYLVGDQNDECGSLACEGGTSGISKLHFQPAESGPKG